MRRSLLIVLGALLLVGAAVGTFVVVGRLQSPAVEDAPAASFGSGVLEVRSGKGGQIATITVEVASSEAARAQGLQGRTSLPPGHGMVFLFPEGHEGSFVMKDTSIALRIGFWDEEGVIQSVMDMDPCREDPCPEYDPDIPYVGAVEATPATFDKANITVGAITTLATMGPR